MRGRVLAMFLRYVLLHLRSAPRAMEMFFWPVMELLLWGFLVAHMRDLIGANGAGVQAGRVAAMLLSGLIFWDVLYRSQQAVSLALMEELWTKNILNVMLTPLRTWEWAAAAYLYGLLKTLIIALTLAGLSWLLYAFSITGALGLALIPFMANLLLMGFAVGLVTAGMLLRWGHAAEALIWGVPFLIQPFSALFYPLTVYPAALRPLCLLLPSTHVMEGMRAVLEGGFPLAHLGWALGLNAVYMALAAAFFSRMLDGAREDGSLARLAS